MRYASMQTALCAVIIALFLILKEYAGSRKEKVKEMDDLIDRKKLINWFSAYGLTFVKMSDVIKAVKDATAVDAVPVVRCRDCNFHGRNKRCVKNGLYTSDGDFCSYGERKTDG